MKKNYKNVLRLGLTLLVMSLFTVGYSQSKVFSENFESGIPASWSVVNYGSGNSWNDYNSATYAVSGTHSMRYNYNFSNAANVYSFTSGISMVAGRDYEMRFFHRVRLGSYPENYRVTLGTSQANTGNLDTLYNFNNYGTTTYAQASGNLYSCTSTGTYYFGFQCYSAANQYDVYIDSVEVFEYIYVNNDASPVAMVNPGSSVCSTADSVKIELKNSGQNALTSATINWKVNGIAQTAKSWTGTLAPGASETVNLGLYTYGSGTLFDMEFITSNPNATTDGNTTNDTFETSVNKGLSGTYTIGGTAPDYTTIAEAITALESNGVCGPVVMDIRNGTYTEQLTIGAVANVSATNTVTFKSETNNAANVTLTYASSVSANRQTFKVDGGEYITLKHLTIKGAGTYAWPVHILGGSEHITVSNCIISTPIISSSNRLPVVINGSATSYTTGALNNFITVDSCDISGGYLGICIRGTSTSVRAKAPVFTNNTITGYAYMGIYSYYTAAVKYSGNYIKAQVLNGLDYGVYCYYNTSDPTLGGIEISNNTVLTGYYGIYLSNCDGTSTARQKVFNNFISGSAYTSTVYGLYNAGTDYCDYYHNSVWVKGPSGTSTKRAFYRSSGSNLKIQNNIFAVTGSGSTTQSYAYYNGTSPNTTTMVVDDNVYYNTINPTNLIYSGGNRTAAVLNTYSASGDANSVEVEPPFTSYEDLHITDGCFKRGTTIAGYGTDIDGETRVSPPHIGGDEAPSLSIDAGVVQVVSPTSPLTAGSQTVTVKVKNFGTTSLSAIKVAYAVNGGTAISQTFNLATALASCDTAEVTFSTGFTATSGCYVLDAYTDLTGDGFAGNDSLLGYSAGLPLSGTFTLGGTTPDYTNFAAAKAVLECSGVSGPVVFHVRSGTYNEQLSLGTYSGMSGANSVTFQSDPANTTAPMVTYAGSGTGDNYVFRFLNSKYFTIDGLHIKSTGTTYGRVVSLDGTNDSISLINNVLEAPSVTTTSADMAVIYDATSANSHNTRVKGNDILNGSYGMYAYGASPSNLQDGLVIDSNNITNFYYQGVRLYNNDAPKFTHNVVTTNSANTNAYYLYGYYSDNAQVISDNRMSGIKDGYGIYLGNNDGTSTNKGLIANNMVQIGTGTASVNALTMTSSKYQLVYHNSFNVTSSYNNVYWPAVEIYASSSTYAGIEVKNNNIANSGGGYALGLYDTDYITSDYNNIWSTSTGNFIAGGPTSTASGYSSISAWSTASSQDANSLNLDPNFYSATDLHSFNCTIYNQGTSLASVSDDIDGDTRSSTPSIGADEYSVSANDAGIASLYSPQIVCTSNTAEVVLINYGCSALTSTNITWSVAGVPRAPYSWTGNLGQGEKDTVTLGSFTATSSLASIAFEAFTSMPNATMDGNGDNDTLSTLLGVGLSGTYTIGGTTPHFASVTDAITYLDDNGLCGPTVFNIRAGVYNEPFTLSNIPGNSMTNTLLIQTDPSATTQAEINSTGGGSLGTGFVVRFNGNTEYITINNLKLTHTGSGLYRAGVRFRNAGNRQISITNNTIENYSPPISSSAYQSNISIRYYDYDAYPNYTRDIEYVNISGNTLINGSIGINIDGNSGYENTNFTVDSNNISNFYHKGISLDYCDTINIRGNVLNSGTSYTSTQQIGLYKYYSDGPSMVSGNQIYMNGTGISYGADLYQNAQSGTDSLHFINNFVSQTNPSSTGFTVHNVWFDNDANLNVSHNNFLTVAANGSTSTGTVRFTQNTATAFYNNNLVNKDGGYAYVNSGSVKPTANNNNYYSTGANLAYGGGTLANLAALQTYSAGDANSDTLDPGYISNSDLHICNYNMFKSGSDVGVSTDIDGITRLNPPTIGAHEIMPDIALTTIVAPDTVCGAMGAAESVQISLANNGNIPLKGIPVYVSLDGGTPKMAMLAGPLATGSTMSFTHDSALDLSSNMAHTIKVWAGHGADMTEADDTISITIPYQPIPMASFTYADTCFGAKTAFASTSTVSSGSITSLWSFGDSKTSSMAIDSNVYAAGGSYTVKLKVLSDLGCEDSTSKVVNIFNDLNQGAIGSSQNVWCNTTPSALSFSTPPSGSSGTYTYQWQSSADDVTYADISGEMASTYAPGVHTSDMYYRVSVKADNCPTIKNTASVKITVDSLSAIFTTTNHCFNDNVPLTNTSVTGSPASTSYAWSFGDANTSTDSLPTHIYANSGNYTIKLVVASNGGCKDSMSNTVNVASQPSPEYTYTMDCTNDSMQFSDNTSILCGSVNDYLWNFDDGTTSTLQNPKHHFNSPGSYDVTLRIGLGGGFKDSITKVVVISADPTASFFANNACLGGSSVFNNSSTNAVSTSWTFGDGGTSSATNPTHTYATSGSFNVELTSTSVNGCTASVTKTVMAYDKPVAGFTASDVCLGNAVSFSNSSTGAGSYTWDFGNGLSSVSSNPSHTYTSANTYTVLLYAESANGCKDTSTSSVTVNGLPTADFSAPNMCIGSATVFTNSSTGATSSSWTFGDGNTSISTSPSHTYASSGTYTVTLTSTNSNTCTETVSKTVEVYSNPTAAFAASNACVGSSIAFSNNSSLASGSFSSSWTFGDGGISANSNPSHTYGSAGTYPVKLVITSSNGCKDSVTNSVTSYANPISNFTLTNECEGVAASFTNTSSGASSYSWSFGNGATSTATNPTHAYNTAGSYTVNLIASSANNCTSSTSKAITIYTNPEAGFTATDVCNGSAMNFVNTSTITTGSMTYGWTFGDAGTSIATDPSNTYASSGSYTATVTATSGNGCKDSYAKTVNVFVNPTANFSATTVCAGTATDFTNSSTLATTYVWDFGDGSSSVSASPVHSYASAGTYSVKLISQNASGCSESVTKTVAVNSNPLADFNTADVCDGKVASFSSTSTGATSYSWNFGDANTGSGTNPTNTYSSAGSYNVELTASSASCSNSITKTINVNPNPVVTYSQIDVCDGASMNFVNGSSISSGIISYSWDFGDASNSTNSGPSHMYASDGNYTVELTGVSDKGCISTYSKTVEVYANPVAAFNASGVCDGDVVSFNNTSSGATGYSWAFGDGNSSMATAPTHTYSSVGNYVVNMIATSDKGCKNSVLGTVKVSTLPSTAFTAANGCLGENTPISNLSTGATSYSWTFGDGNTSADAKPTHTYATANTFDITLTSTSGDGCKSSSTVKATVYDLPTASYSANTVCLGEVTTFTNTSTGTSNIWNFDDGAGSSTFASPSYSYLNAGTYNVVLVTRDANGCSNSVTQAVLVNTTPTANFTVSDVCDVDNIIINNTSIGATTYAWDFGDGNSDNTAAPSYKYANSGPYTITLTASSAANCTDMVQRTVVVNPSPVVNISADTTISLGSTVELFASGGAMYSWSPASTLDNPFGSSPRATPTANTAYTVEVTTNSGCKGTALVNVSVNEDYKLVPVNLFTPNANGQNDVFYVENIWNYPNNTLTVFDGWGRVVYTQDSYDNTWTGVSNDGKLLSDGATYYYVIQLDGTDQRYEGSFTILRNEK